MVLLVVDRYSKMQHFISSNKTHDAVNVAFLLLKEIVRLHVMSKTIIFDKDIRFMSYFLALIIEIVSSVYRPQTSGQTKL